MRSHRWIRNLFLDEPASTTAAKASSSRFWYEVPSDPSRFSRDKLGGFEAFEWVCRLLDDVDMAQYLPNRLFNMKNLPENAGVSTRSWYSSRCLVPLVTLIDYIPAVDAN